MNNLFDLIDLRLSSLKDFQDTKLACDVLSKINEFGKDFIPTVYGLYQPLKNKYDPSNISEVIKFWMNEENNKNNIQDCYAAGQLLMEKKVGHKVSYQMRWEKDNQARFNLFCMRVDISYLKDKDNYINFIKLCKELTSLMEPVYGEIVNLSYPGWDTPINLQVRLPEISWALILGKPYIKMFGEERILSTPCHSIHTISDNVIELQLTDSLFEPIPSSVRTSVKKHLGVEAFVEEGKSYRSYSTSKVPEFDFSGILFDKTKPIVEPQIRTKE